MGLKHGVDSATTPEGKALAEAEYQKQAALFEKRNKSYNDFCEENGLKRKSERITIAKWDREQAAKARAAAKKWENRPNPSGEPIAFSRNDGIIKALDVGKSVGASAKRYSVRMPDSRDHARLANGQSIHGVTFAGKGKKSEIRERFRLEVDYKRPADSFEKVSGKGYVIVDGKERHAELHWYESNNEIFEIKVKRFLDEG